MTKGKWLEENGFSPQGKTFIVMGNSYAIKDELKEARFKFSVNLRWHAATTEFELPKDCYYHEVSYNDLFSWNEELGTTFMKENTRAYLENLFNPPKESKSEFVGQPGDKIPALICKVIHVGGFQSAYGYKWLYIFLDENGNEYIWFTTSQQPFSKGSEYEIAATIKEHSEYKGVKQTVLIRCKINKEFV